MEVYSDASRGDEVVGIGWVIEQDGVDNIEDSRHMLGNYTSMEAEYFALIDALRHAKRYGDESILVYCDCKPLLKKMRVPDGNNEEWYNRRRGCHRLLNKFDYWEMEWAPRSMNERADRLAFEALERGRNL